ncbi:hypothetical protein LTR95_003874, partial [Oleoguttula sp. CCFEE 5521]
MTSNTEKAVIKGKEEPDTTVSLVKLFAYVFLQAGALAAGVFTILGWINSQDAKAQANAANVLSFAALCGNEENESDDHHQSQSQPYISSLCEAALPSANLYLSSMASSMFSVTITANPYATATTSLSSSTFSSQTSGTISSTLASAS